MEKTNYHPGHEFHEPLTETEVLGPVRQFVIALRRGLDDLELNSGQERKPAQPDEDRKAAEADAANEADTEHCQQAAQEHEETGAPEWIGEGA